jgi:hypothetical protein
MRTSLLLGPLAATVLLSLPACGGDEEPTDTGMNDTTATGTGDSSGDGDGTTSADTGDTTSGDGDGTTGDGDGTTGDGDGTSGDGDGDCAGGMSFSMLTSTNNDLVSNLDVAGLVSCNMDITITATGGTICTVDDGNGGYYYTVETIALTDVPPMTCGLADVGLSNISINNIGNYMEVVVPQASGSMTGNQSVTISGDVEGTALGNPIGPTPVEDFNGVLPEGGVLFGAGDTTVTYSDNSTVVATAMPEVAAGISVTITLTGLNGSLTFAQ